MQILIVNKQRFFSLSQFSLSQFGLNQSGSSSTAFGLTAFNSIALFALTISLFLVSSSAWAQPASAPSTTTSQQASGTKSESEPEEGEWQQISPTDALATFLVPKKPRYIERTFTPVANKPPIKVHLYLSTVNKGQTTYIFGYHDLHEVPENTIVSARVLQGAVRGSVVNVQRKLLSEVTKIRFGAWPGRQFNYSYIQNEKTYLVLSRVFIVGKRQYQVSSVALETEFDETLATEFLNSFKLVVIENDEPPVPRIRS